MNSGQRQPPDSRIQVTTNRRGTEILFPAARNPGAASGVTLFLAVWIGAIGFMLAPARTPQPIVRLLNRHVVKIMQTQDVRDRLAGGGSEAVSSSPEELGHIMREDDARMRKLFKQLGLSADS